jgi:Ca2+-binding EF-hand superfamily protein
MQASQAMRPWGLFCVPFGREALMLVWISRIAALIVIGTISALGQAHAQRPNVDAFLQEWDADHDGTLSLEEIKTAADARFEMLDRNHKGTLTRAQLAGMVTFQQFRQADPDKDGKLDKAEFLALVEKLFRFADKDHDGSLDKKELGSSAGRALMGLFAVRQGPVM